MPAKKAAPPAAAAKKAAPPAAAAKKKRSARGKQAGGDGGEAVARAPAAFPAFQIEGAPAFAEVVVKLSPGQSVLLDGGALQYMRGGVEHEGLEVSGIKKFFGRLLAGESLFLNRYFVPEAAPASTVGELAFASAYPGDAVVVDLAAGDKWKLSRGAFIGSSEGVTVTGTLNWRGIVPFGQEEGLVLPEVACDAEGGGKVFLGAYGRFKAHELAQGEAMTVDNGLFLACPSSVTYTIVKLGKSFITSLLGGEGLGMRFEGPCTVYTQSRNFNDLAALIAARLPPSN